MHGFARDKRGFTLIELMIVCVIIGILAAIAIPNFDRMRINTYNATMKSDIHSIFIALEDYRIQNNEALPAASGDLEATTRLGLSTHVTWDAFSLGVWQGHPAVDFTLAHSKTTTRWGSTYPSDPTFVEAR